MKLLSKNKYINTLLWQARIMQRAGYNYKQYLTRIAELKLVSNGTTSKVVHIRPMGVLDDDTKTLKAA